MLKKIVKRVTTERFRTTARFWARRIVSMGWRRYCPVCRSHLRRFNPYGNPVRKEARCPVCGAMERHRLVWLYFKGRTDLFRGKPGSFLHFAPEMEISRRLRGLRGIRYLSTDLSGRTVMARSDIQSIPAADETFDLIYCSHVLDDVNDDRAAMAELWRVLRPGGRAVIQLPPLETGDTVESDNGRFSDGSLRRYGSDLFHRLASRGFTVTVDRFAEQMHKSKIKRLGLKSAGEIYVCSK